MPIDQPLFRRVLGNFTAGVTVVTTVDPNGRPSGLTVTAFSSVSLDPPLVLVCIDKKAETHALMLAGTAFAVNFLAFDQQEVSRRFATSGGDKFAGIGWTPGSLGAPLLNSTIAHVECRTVQNYDGGDHTIFLGEVESAAVDDREALVYFRGSYRRVAARE